MFNLLQFDNLLFVKDFHCMIGAFAFVLDEHDTTKGPSPESFYPVKVIKFGSILKTKG